MGTFHSQSFQIYLKCTDEEAISRCSSFCSGSIEYCSRSYRDSNYNPQQKRKSIQCIFIRNIFIHRLLSINIRDLLPNRIFALMTRHRRMHFQWPWCISFGPCRVQESHIVNRVTIFYPVIFSTDIHILIFSLAYRGLLSIL